MPASNSLGSPSIFKGMIELNAGRPGREAPTQLSSSRQVAVVAAVARVTSRAKLLQALGKLSTVQEARKQVAMRITNQGNLLGRS